MPRYAPHTLPMDTSRPSGTAPNINTQQAGGSKHPSILLGEHIRRERGMHGVRGYVSAVSAYLSPTEHQALCAAMGVSPDVQAPPPVQAPPQETIAQQSPANQGQLLQLLAQLMQGSQAGSGGLNPALLASLLGGGQNAGTLNPALLSSLLGGATQNAGQGGLNPALLAQLLGGMQK